MTNEPNQAPEPTASSLTLRVILSYFETKNRQKPFFSTQAPAEAVAPL